WVGYASRQKQDGMSHTAPDISRAGSTPLKSFYGNFCSSAMFSFMPLKNTQGCFGFGSVADKKFAPVTNPLAPDTCLVNAGDSYPKTPANCVRIQPTFPPPPPQPPPALIAAEDMSYYPTVADGGRFPLHCKDETGDCSVSEAQQRRCG